MIANDSLFKLKNVSINDEKVLIKNIKRKNRNLWSKDDFYKYKESMFKIIAERRLRQILKLLNNFSKLSNRSNYIIDHKILEQCQSKLEIEVRNTFLRFKSYSKHKSIDMNKKIEEMQKSLNELHGLIDPEATAKANKLLDKKNYEIKVYSKK